MERRSSTPSTPPLYQRSGERQGVQFSTMHAPFWKRFLSRAVHFGRRCKRLLRSHPSRLPGHILSTVGYRNLYRILCLLPLNEKKVFFASDRNADMTGNFKYVYEELQERKLDFEYAFMLNKGERKSLSQLVRLAYHLATSKYILLDDFFFKVYGLKIRRDAELIQLWHAVGAFKLFGFSRVGRPGAASVRSQNHRNYTKAIVSSANIANHYAAAFGIDEDKVIATGIPRTDSLFDKTYSERVRAEIFDAFPQLRGKKVITYAPTFRGSGQQSARFEMSRFDMSQVYEAFHQDYICLLRMHPFIKEQIEIPEEFSSFYLDISTSRDMNDWLYVSDVLITDYSSVCFEAALLKIPMLFYAFDLETYTRERDFYYDYRTFVPGPIVESTADLVECIRKQTFETEKLNAFVQYFFDHVDGKSSARVVDWLLLGQRPVSSLHKSPSFVPVSSVSVSVVAEAAVSNTELV